MAYIYYPSCKFTAFSPESSAAISKILKERYGFTIAGCCRPGHKELTAADTAVTVCNTCAAICSEDSLAASISLWEILDQDDAFPLPDYSREEMTLQDCWRAYDRPKLQDAVRSLLRKMNVTIIEQEENREKTRFCGASLYMPLAKENGLYAPHRFIENAQGFFIPHTKEEQQTLMKEHCAKIYTDKVVCYCVPCTKGIRMGGKQGIHLLDLILRNITK